MLKLRWWNKNANRTKYGGSIFSLTDPVYSFDVNGHLGERYYVWLKKQASTLSSQQSDLYADFEISCYQLDDDFRQTQLGEKCFPEFIIYVKDNKGNGIRNTTNPICEKEALIQRR